MNQYQDINQMIDCLMQTPTFLKSLVRGIPSEMLKKQRIKNKWSIHEHVCHLPEAEQMIIKRFEDFKNLEEVHFKPYLPGKTVAADHLIHRNLESEVQKFEKLRSTLIDLVTSFDDTIWRKKASHPEYHEYSAYILLRHTLMHDHFHMYRIEELWLTKDEYLRNA